jgi:hypothetical protein
MVHSGHSDHDTNNHNIDHNSTKRTNETSMFFEWTDCSRMTSQNRSAEDCHGRDFWASQGSLLLKLNMIAESSRRCQRPFRLPRAVGHDRQWPASHFFIAKGIPVMIPLIGEDVQFGSHAVF